jgi:hypothetical protein
LQTNIGNRFSQKKKQKAVIKVTSVSANHLVGEIQGVGDVLRNRGVANIRINGGNPGGRKEMVNASFTYLQIRIRAEKHSQTCTISSKNLIN